MIICVRCLIEHDRLDVPAVGSGGRVETLCLEHLTDAWTADHLCRACGYWVATRDDLCDTCADELDARPPHVGRWAKPKNDKPKRTR